MKLTFALAAASIAQAAVMPTAPPPWVSQGLPANTATAKQAHPTAFTNKDTEFQLETTHGQKQSVHLKTVYEDDQGFLTIDQTGKKFEGHLHVGKNFVTEAQDHTKYLIITQDHHLQLKQMNRKNETTQDWSTNGNLSWNGQQFGMVCPGENNRIIWADEDFSCDGGIGVGLHVVGKASTNVDNN